MVHSHIRSPDAVCFLGARALVHRGDELFIVESDVEKRISGGLREVLHLTGSVDGRHFAFYSNGAFHLWSVDGGKVFERPVNTDKSTANDVKFSTSGDAVAFAWDYDGGHQLHCFEIDQARSQHYRHSASPVGMSSDLRRFVMMVDCRQAGVGVEMTILDRHKDVRGSFFLPFRDWTALGLDTCTNEFAVLRRGNLYWFTPMKKEYAMSMLAVLPESTEISRPSRLFLHSRYVATFAPSLSVARLYFRQTGRVVLEPNISGLSLTERGPVVWNHGKVGFWGDDFRSPIMWTPSSGTAVLSANVQDGVIYVCEDSSRGLRVSASRLQAG